MSKQETEYKIKSNPQTMPYPLSAYLKWENSPHTRQVIDAPAGTKMGEFVDYEPYGSKLLALSDEQNGKVMVQPQDCIIEYIKPLGGTKPIAFFGVNGALRYTMP